MDDIIIVIAALTIFFLILGLMHHDKENKKMDKEYEGSIKETPKLKIECEDFEEFLTEKESNFINEYKYLKTLLLKLKAAEIKNEEGLNNYIRDQFKALNAEEALYKQTIFKELEEIFATYLGDYENGASHTKINEKNYRNNISFSDAEQYHAFVQRTHGILGFLMMQKLSEESDSKEISKNSVRKNKSKKTSDRLSKTQIKDRQAYGAVRAYCELMKIDNDIDPKEILVIGALTEKEQEKISDDYSQDSDEFKFVWTNQENLTVALATYNDNELTEFFENLFIIATSDGILKDIEVSFLITLYKDITLSNEKVSRENVLRMFNNWKEKNNL